MWGCAKSESPSNPRLIWSVTCGGPRRGLGKERQILESLTPLYDFQFNQGLYLPLPSRTPEAKKVLCCEG